MRRRNEDYALHALDQAGRFRVAIAATGISDAQELLNDQATQAVAYKDQRNVLQLARAKKALDDILCTVLNRHTRAQPVAWRCIVGEYPGRQARNVTRKPIWPKALSPWSTAPRIIGMSTKTVNKHDIEPCWALPPGDLY